MAIDEEDLFGQPNVPSYGRPKQFSEASESSSFGASNPQNEAFQQYQENQAYKANVGKSASDASTAFKGYEEQTNRWVANNIDKIYRKTHEYAPDSSSTVEERIADIDNFYKGSDDAMGIKAWDQTKRAYGERQKNLLRYQGLADSTGDAHRQLLENDARTDPLFKQAYNNWKQTTGGKKASGADSLYMDPEKANEVLDFLNFKEPRGGVADYSTMAGLKDVDPRYDFGGGIAGNDRNKLQLERRKMLMRGEFEALFGEHRQARRLKQAGFTAPTWMNQIAGHNGILSTEEREHLLFDEAKKAKMDTFTDPETGQKISISEYQPNYSEEETVALRKMNELGQLRTEYNQMQMKYWAGLSKEGKHDPESEEFSAMELVKARMDESVRELGALGFSQTLYGRAQSVSDVGKWGGYIRQGSIQDDMADFSDNLVGSADNMSAKDWQALVDLASDQQTLAQHMQENDYSPLANIMRKSAEEKDSWFEALGRWVSMDGMQAFAELAVTQLSGFLPEYIDTGKYSIATGALTGMAAGPGGAVAGAGIAAKVNWGIASATMEYASTILELMQEEGVDIHNPHAMAHAWANDDLRGRLQTKAGKRTGMVALFDTVSAGMAGKVMAIAKTPSVLKELPKSVVPGLGKSNLRGLTVEETKRYNELRKAIKKGKGKGKEADKIQRGDPEFDEFEKLEAILAKNKGMLGNRVIETPFSRALANSDKQVNRLTFKSRARNAAAELGVGSVTGGAGDLFGQLSILEPGEDIEKQQVLAEMLAEGIGPGGIGAAIETFSAPDFTKTKGAVVATNDLPPSDPNDPYGYQGAGQVETINNQGWQYEQYSFEDSSDTVALLAKIGNLQLQVPKRNLANPEGAPGMEPTEMIDNPKIQFLQEFISGIENMVGRRWVGSTDNPLKLKFAISDRTPEGKQGKAYYQQQGNDAVIYLNMDKIDTSGTNKDGTDDIVSAIMHELPHVVAHTFYGDAKILAWYEQLSETERMASLAHYMFKDKYGKEGIPSFVNNDGNRVIDTAKFSPNDKKLLDAEFAASQQDQQSKLRVAHEWFTHEFARVLAGSMRDEYVQQKVADKKGGESMGGTTLPPGEGENIKAFIDQYIFPMYSKWIGSGFMVDGKPAKMGPADMYAQILHDMGWGVNRNGDVVYTEERALSGRKSVHDLNTVMDRQKKMLLGNDRRVKTLMDVVRDSPYSERVEINPQATYKTAEDGTIIMEQPTLGKTYDEDGNMYNVLEADLEEEGETIASAEEIRKTIDAEVDRRMAEEPSKISRPREVEDPSDLPKVKEVDKSPATPVASTVGDSEPGEKSVTYEESETKQPQRQEFTEEQRAKIRENALKRLDKSSAKDLDKRAEQAVNVPITSPALKGFFKRGAVDGKGNYTIAKEAATNISKAIRQMDDRGKQSILFRGEETSREDLNTMLTEAQVMVEAYERQADAIVEQETMKLNTAMEKKGSDFKPAVYTDAKGKPVPGGPQKEDTSAAEKQQKQVTVDQFSRQIQAATGMTPEAIITKFEKSLKMTPEELLKDKDFKEVADALQKETGRVTVEEVYSRYLEKLGVTALAEANLVGARSRLDPKAVREEGAIDEAYNISNEETQALMSTIDEAIKEQESEAKAQEKLQTELRKGTQVPKAEGADSLNDAQIKQVVNNIGGVLRNFEYSEKDQRGRSRDDQLKAHLHDSLVLNVEDSTFVDELVSFLQAPVLKDPGDTKQAQGFGQKLKFLTREKISGQDARTLGDAAKMQELIDPVVEKLAAGVVKGVVDQKQFENIGKAEEKKVKAKAAAKRLRKLKTAVSIGTEAGNYDYRDQPVLINFKPDEKSRDARRKGTNFQEMVLVSGKTERSLTLGDLATNNKLTVKFKGSDKTYTIDGKDLLSKMDESFSWESASPAQQDAFEAANGIPWREQGLAIVTALASLRKGETVITARGMQDTNFFGADTGVAPAAVLLEKIKRLQDNPIEKVGSLAKLERYDSAYQRQLREARQIREASPEFIANQERRDMVAEAFLGIGRTFEDLKNEKRSVEQLMRTKQWRDVRKLTRNNLAMKDLYDVTEEISRAREVQQKRKLKKAYTVTDLLKDMAIDQGSMSGSKAGVKAPRSILPRDQLNINLTAGAIAEDMFGSESEILRAVIYNRRFMDFVLSTEANLIADVEFMNNVIESKKAPKKTLQDGVQFKKGDLFRHGTRIYKASKDFEVNNFTARNLKDFANLAESIALKKDDPSQTLYDLSPEEVKEFIQRRDSASKLIEKLATFNPDFNDVPGFKDRYGALQAVDRATDPVTAISDSFHMTAGIESAEYRDVVMNMYEDIAAGGYNESFLQKMAEKSKGQSHMEHYHVENWANTRAPEIQKQGLRELGLTSFSAAERLRRRLIDLKKKDDPNENYRGYDPNTIDKVYNMAQFYLRALERGDPRIVPHVSLKIEQRDGSFKTITDFNELTTTYREEWEQEINRIKNLYKKMGLEFLAPDNFKHKSDPVLRALQMDPEIHSAVRDKLDALAKEAKQRIEDPRPFKLTNAERKTIFAGRRGTSKRYDTLPETVEWNPNKTRAIDLVMSESTEGWDRFMQLRQDEQNGKELLFKKGEDFFFNRKKVTVKEDITNKSPLGRKILSEGTRSFDQWASLMAENPTVFVQGKTQIDGTPSKIKVTDKFVKQQIRYKRIILKETKEMLKNPAMAGEQNAEARKVLDGIRVQIEQEIISAQDFLKYKVKKPSLWDFTIVQGHPRIDSDNFNDPRHFTKSTIRKEGDEWFVQTLEDGTFTDTDGKTFPREVENRLFDTLYRKFAGERANKDFSDNSLAITPREAVNKLIESGGFQNVQRLAGSYSSGRGQWYADTAGGFPLLPYLDALPDAMLNDLQGEGAIDTMIEELNKRIKEAPKNKQGKQVRKKMEDEVAVLEAMKESDLDLNDMVMMRYVSEFKFRNAKRSEIIKKSDGGFTEADIDAINTAILNRFPDDNPKLVVATKTNQKFSENQIIKVGKTQPVTDESGKVTERERDVYARVTFADVSKVEDEDAKPGERAKIKAVSFDEFNESSELDADDKRWPKQKRLDTEKKEDVPTTKAFAYELEIITDVDQIMSAFFESEKQDFLKLKPEQRKAAAEARQNFAETQSDFNDAESRIIMDRVKQMSVYSNLAYLEKTDKALYNLLIEDIINQNNYLESKWKTIAQVVDLMGGLRLEDQADVVAAQRQVDADADTAYAGETDPNDPTVAPNESGEAQGRSRERRPGDEEAFYFDPENIDLGKGTKPKTDPSFGVKNKGVVPPRPMPKPKNQGPTQPQESIESMLKRRGDVSFGLGSDFSPKAWDRMRSPSMLSRIADKVSGAFKTRINQIRNKELPPEELDLGQREGIKGKLMNHTGAYGKFVEQFGPWLKAEGTVLQALNADEKTDNVSKLKAYDRFYEGMGIAGDLLDEGHREYVSPITDAFYETKANETDVGWYLYALIAPQVNQAVRENRKRMGKGDINDPAGSGITNQEAATIIKHFEDSKGDQAVAVQRFIQHRNNPIKMMFDMHKKSLNTLYSYGVISMEARNKMMNAAKPKAQPASKYSAKFGDFQRLPLRGLLGDEDLDTQSAEIADILGGATGEAQGRGFDQLPGSIFQPTLGRKVGALANPDKIFASGVQDFENAVIRASRARSADAINEIYVQLEAASKEGNEVAKKVFERMFESAEPITATRNREFLDENGKVVYEITEADIPAEIANKERAFFVREAGQPKLIMFADTTEGTLLASAAKNLTYQQLGDWMKVINVSTRYLARVRTSWSPEFWARNPIRDIGSAWFNLGDNPKTKAIRKQVANPLTFAKDAASIYDFESAIERQGKPPEGLGTMQVDQLVELAKGGSIQAAYQLLKKMGGKTAFYKFKNVREIIDDLRKQAKTGRKGGKIRSFLRGIVSVVDMLNTSLENVLRARVVMHGLQAGLDLDTLIPAARDVTVDFNKRGTYSQQLSAVVQFANPSIQGPRRTAKALAGRGLVGSANLALKISTVSALYNSIVRLLTTRDEDEEDDYSTYHDDISDRVRYTGVTLPHKILGDQSKTPGYSVLPLAYGPHNFWAFGELLSKIGFNQGRNLVADTLNFVTMTAETNLPLASIPIPALESTYQLLSNRDFKGAPIYLDYEGSENEIPRNLSKRSTPEIYNKLSDGINYLAGGNDKIAGTWGGVFSRDPIKWSEGSKGLGGVASGSGLEFIIETLTGSMGGTAMNVFNSFVEDDWSKFKIPVAKGLVKTKGSAFVTIGKFYNLRDRAKRAEETFKAMNDTEKKEILKNRPHYRQMINLIKATDNAMNAYRRRRDALMRKERTDAVIQETEKNEEMRINVMRRTLGKAIDLGIDV